MRESVEMTAVPVRLEEAPRAQNMLSVVIPALNEEESIRDIVLRVRAAEEGLRLVGIEHTEILVVDDGSRDRTGQIVEALPGVRLVRHSRTRGYGAAIKTGFAHARGDWLAFLDADGTYPPEQLPALCRVAIEHDADVVVGSRRSGGASRMPAVRRLGNVIWSNLLTFIGNRRCIDPASGMRVLRRAALPQLYPLPDGLNFTPVMSTRALHEELKVIEIPIAYMERVGRSKLSVIHDGSRFLKTILWTALEYNPARILGLVGVAFVYIAALMGFGLVLVRAQGVTTLGPWGAFSVFATLVLAVAGMSVYSLGITFSFLVSLFHRRSALHGISRGPALMKVLEPHLGWLGACSVALGMALAMISMVSGGKDWDIARIWLWLLGSALFVLVGTQLVISWVLARVVEKLSEREATVTRELRVPVDQTGNGRNGGMDYSASGPIGAAGSPA